ncbi:MAG: type II secretion system F family protein [Candidatus Micrarchaeia archaeon]
MAEQEKQLPSPVGKHKSKAPQPFVASPVRENEGPADPVRFRNFMVSLASRFPTLKKQLSQADMHYTPAGFVQASLFTAFFITAMILIIGWLLIKENYYAPIILIVATPVVFVMAFFYAMYLPKVKSTMRAKRMEQELVFAGRHMLIELKAGVPLFDAMLGISRDYGEISAEMNKVVEKVTLGVPMGVALHEVADSNPSQYFSRVILQMANSLASGSDVALALEASLDQISKEQVIALKAYGQKLNPLVMFFMIFGIIMPSLGVAFIIILASFLGSSSVTFGSSALFGIMIAVGLIQFIFLTMVESSRPKFDIV